MTKEPVTRHLSTEHFLRELQVAKASIGCDPESTRRHLDALIQLVAKRYDIEESSRGDTTQGGPALAPWQAKRVDAFIADNLARTILIEELAGIARISIGHFFRAFRGSFGTAPHNYIVERRIERAERRMRESECSLAEVALDCGFADQAHFSRAFAKHAGIQPGAWRKMQLVHASDDLKQSA